MFTYERQEKILDLIRQKNAVSVEQLASSFYISEATVRRDLDVLERSGLIKRTHGGAVSLEGKDKEMPLLFRENDNTKEKNKIADKAVKLISDGNIIMMDSSTTVLTLARKLNDFSSLTVVTNGIRTANLLSGADYSMRVICTGGYIRENSSSMVGQHACEHVGRYNADLFFFSCCGLSATAGVTESSDEEALIKKIMLEAAGKKVLLCDSTKLNKVFLSRVCSLGEIDYLICDTELPENILEALSNTRAEFILA